MMEIISLHHSGFAIITDRSVVIIDYFKDPYCIIPPLLKTGKSVYVLSSHRHHDHFREEVLTWSDVCADIKYIFSSDIKRVLKLRGNDLSNSICFIKKLDIYNDANLKVQAFGSTDVGVSFLLELDEKVVFHAGDLNNWHWEKESTLQEIKKAEGDFMAVLRDISKCVEAFDVAMFPVDTRMCGDYARGTRQFLQQFKVDYFIPMHTWGQWKEACDFSVYKNDKYGKYVCLKDGESLSLKKTKNNIYGNKSKV